MPKRLTSITTNHTYHIFNRGVAGTRTFFRSRDYARFLKLVRYYQYQETPISFSNFEKLNPNNQLLFWQSQQTKSRYIVSILAYCLMPNHFHLLLEQQTDQGIQNFIRKISNAYTKYINQKHSRFGPLFAGRFQAVHVKSDEQLCHVSRYMHLNPHTSFLIDDLSDLALYPWSSFAQYTQDKSADFITSTQKILSFFKSKEAYQKFVYDQANYQQHLASLKKTLHLL